MAALSSDRNLLFGILALQLDFISREDLIGAMHAWVLKKSEPIGEILREQKRLSADRLRLLETLVDEHLKQHGNEPQHCLRSIGAIESIRDDLRKIADPDVETSLGHVLPNRAQDMSRTAMPDDPNRTRAATLGESASDEVRFPILRPHARGGLGQVSVALDRELKREVALKELQDHHADDPHSRARFTLEAEITGGLEHPGIVPVYGMGQYADGRPFYAMRLIRGDSLRDAIERFHKPVGSPADVTLSKGERAVEFRKLISRFITVCNAVEYAHSRGVLHRDLKPSNVMLGKYGETLVVDWGLAKAMGRSEDSAGSSDEVTLRPSSGSGFAPTQIGSAIGTPAFMSPEQAAGRVGELSPRSDVYSLGATLYNLLTGRAPFGDNELAITLRKVQHGDFPKPREVAPAVPATLEAICLRAMALNPGDRYQTPIDLAQDLERWLADEPVRTYREPAAVRVGRWMRHHRVFVGTSVAAGAVMVVSLLMLLMLVTAHSREVEAQKLDLERANEAEVTAKRDADERRLDADRLRTQAEGAAATARTEAERARVTSDFLQGMFEAADPIGITGWKFGLTDRSRSELTARQILEQGEQRIAAELQDEPVVRASLLNSIGKSFLVLADRQRAERLLTASLALRREMYGDSHLDVAESMQNLAWLRHELGEYDEAEKLYRQAIEIRREHLAADSLPVAESMFYLGWLLGEVGRYEESETILREVIAIRRKRLGNDHRLVAVALTGLAGICFQRNDADAKVLEIMKEAMQIYSKQEGDRVFADAIQAFQMGLFQHRVARNLDAAEEQFRKALKLGVQALGDHHPYLGLGMSELASLLISKNQLDEAEATQLQAIEICGRVLDPDHPKMVLMMDNLAEIVEQKGELRRAAELYQKTVELQKQWLARHLADRGAKTALSAALNHASNALWKIGDIAGAIEQGRAGVAIGLELVDILDNPEGAISLASAYNHLGDLYLANYQPDLALPCYEKDLRLMLEIATPNAKDSVRDDLAYTYEDLYRTSIQLGQIDRAAEYARQEVKIRTALAGSRQKPADRRKLIAANNRLAEIAFHMGRTRQAQQLYREMEEVERSIASSGSARAEMNPDIAQTVFRIGNTHEELGEFAEATVRYREVLTYWTALAESAEHSKAARQWIHEVTGRIATCENATSAIDQPDIANHYPPEVATRLLRMRARVLAKRGLHDQALSAGQQLQEMQGDRPNALFEIALLWSVCGRSVIRSRVEAARDNEELALEIEVPLTPGDQTARDRYLELALNAVNQAVDAGWRDLEALSTSVSLVSLRQHPKYAGVFDRLRSEWEKQSKNSEKTGDTADSEAK